MTDSTRFSEKDIARFWIKVGEPDPASGCREWQASRDSFGYGKFKAQRRCWRAPRFAWTVKRGNIPDGLLVLHRCDNPSCCNIDHLFVGTNGDNVRDMYSKGRARRDGENNGRSKLDATAVVLIRSSDDNVKALSDRYGVSISTIKKVRQGESWRGLKG
jgi:hypothetical protein